MNVHSRLAAWYFAYFAFIGAFLPYFSLYLESLGLSPAKIGVLMSVGQIVRTVVPALWGWLSDRRDSRVPLIRLSALLSLLCFGAYFLTGEFAGLLLATLLLHLFWSGALPLVEALTFAHLQNRPEHYGRIRLWGSIGFIASVSGVGLLLDHWPIASLWWCGWVLLAAVAVVAWSLGEAVPTHGEHQSPPRGSLREARVVALLVAGFFMAAAHGPLYVFYSIHLVDHGYSTTTAGLLWTLGVIAEIVVFLAMPRLGRRFELKSILLACFALAALRFLLIGHWADILACLLFAQVLHAATFGAHHAATVAALSQWFAPGQQGRIQALYGSLSFGAGGTLGSLLAGQSWQNWGAAVTYSMAAAFAAIGLLVVLFGLPARTAALDPMR